MSEFIAWPKTHRLFRDIVVTEKIDGTNACVTFEPGVSVSHESVFSAYPLKPGEFWDGERVWHVTAQSRKRIITPEDDNYGFARWVHDHAAELFDALGPGRHYGEWWGKGVQRGYDAAGKRFALFNTAKHEGLNRVIGNVPVKPVPVLYQGPFSEARISDALQCLKTYGSYMAPGFMNPEGVCVFHSQTRSVFKATLDHNDAGKWEAA